jgi:hypothetical protein
MAAWEDEEEKVRPEPGTACETCGATGRWLALVKCPMCHTYVCEKCTYKYGGKDFCSRHCANEFYWGGEDGDADS